MTVESGGLQWWNPTIEEQAIDRAHRIGQTRTVHVTRITIAGTTFSTPSMQCYYANSFPISATYAFLGNTYALCFQLRLEYLDTFL